ncbi:MAG: TraB/GumN family protein, partial [Bacteroidetes bacterium]
TAEFQMSLFDEIPYKEQAQMLVQAIEAGREAEEDMMQRMVDLYLDQDIVGMQAMMSEADSGVVGYEEILLLQRNRNWIPVMAELMKQGSVFFAVGAGHLAGDEGVITLLRKAGYQVEAVR